MLSLNVPHAQGLAVMLILFLIWKRALQSSWSSLKWRWNVRSVFEQMEKCQQKSCQYKMPLFFGSFIQPLTKAGPTLGLFLGFWFMLGSSYWGCTFPFTLCGLCVSCIMLQSKLSSTAEWPGQSIHPMFSGQLMVPFRCGYTPASLGSSSPKQHIKAQ